MSLPSLKKGLSWFHILLGFLLHSRPSFHCHAHSLVILHPCDLSYMPVAAAQKLLTQRWLAGNLCSKQPMNPSDTKDQELAFNYWFPLYSFCLLIGLFHSIHILLTGDFPKVLECPLHWTCNSTLSLGDLVNYHDSTYCLHNNDFSILSLPLIPPLVLG
jgi:hypothetical protein